MSLELSKLQGCVLNYSNYLLSNMTDVAWQHCCCATCQISKWLENLKYQSHAFCYWLKIYNTLRYCFIVISDHILYGPPKGYTTQTTQRFTVDGPLGDAGFATLGSTVTASDRDCHIHIIMCFRCYYAECMCKLKKSASMCFIIYKGTLLRGFSRDDIRALIWS